MTGFCGRRSKLPDQERNQDPTPFIATDHEPPPVSYLHHTRAASSNSGTTSSLPCRRLGTMLLGLR